MKWTLTIAAILVLIASIYVGVLEHIWVMVSGIVSFVALLFFANLDRIEEIKASRSGIEARTRKVITEAKDTLEELRFLAKKVGELTLSLVKRTGRWDGYADHEEDAIKESVLDLLRKVGVAESEFPDILKDWHRTVEFDYAHYILGGSTVPDTADQVVMTDWRELRDGGLDEFPTPEQLRTFLDKHEMLSDEIMERLLDYEYYKLRREHRRPEVWGNREKWGRLGPPTQSR